MVTKNTIRRVRSEVSFQNKKSSFLSSLFVCIVYSMTDDDDDGNSEEREKREGEKKRELMYSIDIYKQAMCFVKKKGRSRTTFEKH